MHLCKGPCNPPLYIVSNSLQWNYRLLVLYPRLLAPDGSGWVGLGVAEWLSLGLVPGVEGVGDEWGELADNEPLELGPGGGSSAGGCAGGWGGAAGAGGAGSAGAGGALIVGPKGLKSWNWSPVVQKFWYVSGSPVRNR